VVPGRKVSKITILLLPSAGWTSKRVTAKEVLMNPLMLRQLWSSIENSQVNILLSLDDTSLIQWLIKQFKQEQSLNQDETNMIDNYLRTKLSLIRDIAQERIGTESMG
jgi:hypothetical protein